VFLPLSPPFTSSLYWKEMIFRRRKKKKRKTRRENLRSCKKEKLSTIWEKSFIEKISEM
jgi:hypothetical protein